MTELDQIPESQQNPPEDRSTGYKPWDETRVRWWMGNQWSDTYSLIYPKKEKPEYIKVTPVVDRYWNVTAVGTLSGDILLADRFNNIHEAAEFAEGQASEGVEVKIELEMDPYEKTSHSEETMIKVYTALMGLKIERKQAFDIVRAIQNEGVLFRERAE